MDDLNKTAEDDDKKKNKAKKMSSFGFKENTNKSALPIPISQSGFNKSSRPASALPRPATPKFRKKHVVQPQPPADIIRKAPEKITLTANRFGFQKNASLNSTNKGADLKQNGSNSTVRVKSYTVTTTEPILISNRPKETHFTTDHFVRMPAPAQRSNFQVISNAVKSSKSNTPAAPAARVTLHSSNLPRPQVPIKFGRPGSAADNFSPPKYAKMAANNDAKARSRSCPKTRLVDRNTPNNQSQSRLEMKTLRDELEVTEMISLPALRGRSADLAPTADSNKTLGSHDRRFITKDNYEFSSSSDEEESITQSEEKMKRDIMGNEKSAMSQTVFPCDQWNEGEGEGEAMATDLLPDISAPDDIGDSSGVIAGIDKPLRSVLLTIEDQAFAVLAALSTTELIENETSPEDLMSISPPLSESHDLPPSSKPTSLRLEGANLNPGSGNGSGSGSPCTPTHPSHSLSICSDERDYFDDEIADQPGLVFDDDTTEPITTSASVGPLSSSATDADDAVTVLDIQQRNAQSYVCNLLNMSSNRSQSSLYTSSRDSCESVASDDLILDFNRNDSSYSNELDDNSRFANSTRTSNCTLHSNFVSGSMSPCSAISSSPYRSSRNSNINSSFDNSFSDSGIRLDQNTYQHLFQDIVCIKTMLLRLRRVLTQNELQKALSNSSVKLYDCDEQDQLSDMKRQLILLQQEMEEKNRKICILETQVEKYNVRNSNVPITLSPLKKSTSATQTERLRT